ncbi:MAG: arginine--tRNA ligase [Fretibacterium sp.]|nr:arginine--tRNA ligase [Fretibacterium sp.]
MKNVLQEAVRAVAQKRKVALPDELTLELERPRFAEQGDRASSAAMQFSKLFKLPPRELAALFLAELKKDASGFIESLEIAGPGFINMFLSKKWFATVVEDVISSGPQYGALNLGKGRKVQVEFVSANPTGPLHIGHGRGAAVGDTVANILSFTGWKVEREYYINDADAGLQMNTLGQSVQARYFELLGKPEEAPFPETGYKGEYIVILAQEALKMEGDRFLHLPLPESLKWFKRHAGDAILAQIRKTLEDFGVQYDVWFSEQSLYDQNLVAQAMEDLKCRDYAFESDGALWFKSSDFNDDKDRVLIRTDGAPTYFASDIAYHRNKFVDRGFDRVIDVWGADHHGYIPRMKAGVQALGRRPEDLDVLLIQLVNLMRGGKPVAMSTRAGVFVLLQDVLDEVGRDATRFFFLMRRSDSQLDFDLELAKTQGNDNPVYYVQYAHARISSVMRGMVERGGKLPKDARPAERVFENEEARRLADCLASFPREMQNASEGLAPQMLTAYAELLAGCFHSFYNTNRILGEELEMEQGRIILAEGTRIVLRTCLDLLGVSAPERM